MRNLDQICANHEGQKRSFDPRPVEPPHPSLFYANGNTPKVLPRQNEPSHVMESRPVVEEINQAYRPPHATKVSFEDARMEKSSEIPSSSANLV
jgi:hypothetical protein